VRRNAVVKNGQVLDEEVWVRLSATPGPKSSWGDPSKKA
jgi:hypothetical protein